MEHAFTGKGALDKRAIESTHEDAFAPDLDTMGIAFLIQLSELFHKIVRDPFAVGNFQAHDVVPPARHGPALSDHLHEGLVKSNGVN